jgi:bifunctional non-homologous end joining protein LigD
MRAFMGLREYHRKRNFKVTPEPHGSEKSAAGRSFVVQKHDASRLHYDFRLEDEGVLKSWAVPKGPSLDPAQKRLAMQVEDHPVDYGSFEGVIPEGEYGGGTVLLWDRGTWEPLDDPARGLREGKLKFRLNGEKLHGTWMLVRTKGRSARDAGRSWLLFKEHDTEARPLAEYDVEAARPESVTTGRDLPAIAADRDRTWHSDRDEGAKAEAVPLSPRLDPSTIPGARRAALPKTIVPQLATLVDEPPPGDDWLHEMKLDGYRILARRDKDRVTLLSRNGHDWTAHFPAVARVVGALPVTRVLLDGEVAVVLPDGTTSFQALQNTMAGETGGAIVYFVFDLLHLDGYDLAASTLAARKQALQSLVPPASAGGTLRYNAHVVGAGQAFFDEACRHRLEGIVSKRRDAPYAPGRGRTWLKVKCLREQEFVIGGFTEPDGGRPGVGALLLGVYDGERLVDVGRVGTGFTEATLRDLRRRLDAIAQKGSPFAHKVTGRAMGRVHWVRPELVAQVAFSEWTSDGKLRHPSFQGLREDKKAEDVVREAPASMRGARDDAPMETQGVRLTHPERVLYPDTGATKRDLVAYYEAIADTVLPHLRDRPTALVRCPEGLAAACFYQKHTGYWAPEVLRRVKIREQKKTGEYLIAETRAALVGLVQMDILEIHTWGSTMAHLEQPDRIVFDLDPDPSVEWSRVVEAARAIRARLRALSLESWVKTTGGKGLHVVMPIVSAASWDECTRFAAAVAASLVREAPDRYVDQMAKAKRKGKIFVDYLRNVRGATAVAAYSTRAKPGAPVSVPLAWDELDARTRPDSYTITTVPPRLARLREEPWKGYWTVEQGLPRA